MSEGFICFKLKIPCGVKGRRNILKFSKIFKVLALHLTRTHKKRNYISPKAVNLDRRHSSGAVSVRFFTPVESNKKIEINAKGKKCN